MISQMIETLCPVAFSNSGTRRVEISRTPGEPITLISAASALPAGITALKAPNIVTCANATTTTRIPMVFLP